MQFWLARRSEIPIREQLVTQIVLGILSDDLPPGRRLPSIRDLARRFRVHANTVSAAYRQLERDLWVESRHGSGVYVREARAKAQLSSTLALDQKIADLFRSARETGVPLAAVRSRLRQWLEFQPPDRFLVIEPDEELRGIAVAEISAVVSLPVEGAGMEACRTPTRLSGSVIAALPSKLESVRRALPAGTECLRLELRSVNTSLAQWLPVKRDLLIGVASRWPEFLKSARTMLVAAGFDSDGLVFRDARKAGWEKGLRDTVAVVCDSLLAKSLPKGCRAIPFALLSEKTIGDLREYQTFIEQPLA